ncbi:MAG: DNA-binding protein WhiA [Thermoleophilia bacterium]|nr:DNA-binding protein WhiA [Thermoleophilia bacterium]
MSFTSSVKQELNRVSRERSCCRTAETAALFRAAGSFHILGRERYGLHASFGLSAAARTAVSLVRSFGLPTEVRVSEERRLGRHRRFEIHLEGSARLVQFLNEIGVLSDGMSLRESLPGRILSRRCCQASFERGSFVAAGSVSEPGAPAHLEIYSDNAAFLDTVRQTAAALGLTLNLSRRRRHPAAYSKSLGTIRDFLVATGAHRAAIEFEERSIMSRVREEANRLANCDQANAARCSAAAARQLEAIRDLERQSRLDSLSPGLLEIADLRLRHPSATIAELGRRARPPLSKSAVNHRLRRLLEAAG